METWVKFSVLAAALGLGACAGPAASHRKTLDELYAAGDFPAAVERLRRARDEYGSANEVAYRLDLGLALLDAKRFDEADRELGLAQRRMEQLWTLSVSKRAAAAVANENADDYRGEDFERALSHVFRALGLAEKARIEEALVEARRVESFLDSQVRADPRARTYDDDAFARWLSARLYEDEGLVDDARVSDEAGRRAYGSWREKYGTFAPPPPQGAGESELAVVVLEGPAPRKERVSGGGPLGLLLRTSYPVYVAAQPKTARAVVSVGDAAAQAAIVADIARIAAKDLEERLLALKTRSTARAVAKLALSAVGVDARESEFADVRRWSNLPARLRLARLRLPAGRTLARLTCLDEAGAPVRAAEISVDLPAGGRVWWLARCP